MARLHDVASFLIAVFLVLPSGSAADPFWGADPAWNLIHEPAVERELKLSSAQSREWRRLLDALDAKFFPLRSAPPEKAAQGVTETFAELRKSLDSLLSKAQRRRLAEIQTRRQGTSALLQPPLATAMRYEPQQKEQLETIVSETLAATQELEKLAASGHSRPSLEKQYEALKQNELRKVTGVLSPAQRSVWRQALGRDFDLGQLGQPRFKPPELVDSGAWLHTEPLRLASLTGKVVVLHFYAFGCINCIRNYPTYLEWQDRFRDKDVVIIGIHTPETAAEGDSASVRSKAEDAKFRFPILIDGEKANWNAWGNSMWPSVYLIDKRGYLRHYWPGELQWQGATGDVWMRERIDELLAEPAPR